MAKRFTDTNKYKKPFIRGLQGAYKLLWDYLYHDCDHAGIWIVDFDIAQLYIGKDMPINRDDALRYFNTPDEKRVIEFDHGARWYLPSFISFQYGELNELNRAHNSVICILKKYSLYKIKPLTSPLQGRKDKDMDKDKDLFLIKDLNIPDIYASTFLNWLRYKRKKGQSYKDEKSTELAFKKLLKFSENDPMKAIKVVEKAMGNNWDGMFPLDKSDLDEIIQSQPKPKKEYPLPE